MGDLVGPISVAGLKIRQCPEQLLTRSCVISKATNSASVGSLEIGTACGLQGAHEEREKIGAHDLATFRRKWWRNPDARLICAA